MRLLDAAARAVAAAEVEWEIFRRRKRRGGVASPVGGGGDDDRQLCGTTCGIWQSERPLRRGRTLTSGPLI